MGSHFFAYTVTTIITFNLVILGPLNRKKNVLRKAEVLKWMCPWTVARTRSPNGSGFAMASWCRGKDVRASVARDLNLEHGKALSAR